MIVKFWYLEPVPCDKLVMSTEKEIELPYEAAAQLARWMDSKSASYFLLHEESAREIFGEDREPVETANVMPDD